jgi:hypothetical protein
MRKLSEDGHWIDSAVSGRGDVKLSRSPSWCCIRSDRDLKEAARGYQDFPPTVQPSSFDWWLSIGVATPDAVGLQDSSVSRFSLTNRRFPGQSLAQLLIRGALFDCRECPVSAWPMYRALTSPWISM